MSTGTGRPRKFLPTSYYTIVQFLLGFAGGLGMAGFLLLTLNVPAMALVSAAWLALSFAGVVILLKRES